MKFSIEDCYSLLGVPQNATANEIKKAFRAKAKELHPDKNKAEDAQQKFIELTQAFGIISEYLENGYYFDEPDIDFEEKENEEDIRRKEAEAYAKMKYEAFTKTDFYINDQAFLIILEHIELLFFIIFITAPLLGYLIFQGKGIWMGLLVTFCTVPIWAQLFQKKNKINLPLLMNAFKRVFKLKETHLTIGIVFNSILFFTHTLKTVLPTSFFLTSILLFIGICFAVNFLKVSNKVKYRLVYIGLPFLFNYFFWINATFSNSPSSETHHFKTKMVASASRHSHKKLEESTTLLLENDAYKEYHYLRMFYDYDEMKNKKQITYQFEKGLFGLKVLKSWHF